MKRINVFSDEYHENEVSTFCFGNDKLKYDKDGIVVKYTKLNGRCDDYLNPNVRFTGIEVPIFYIDDKLWMSLTPMEVQSLVLAIRNATGKVAALGVGMGYYIATVMESDNVDSIDAYEVDERVIEYFRSCFRDRDGFEKVSLIHGDARKLFKGKSHDFVFADIYDRVLPESVIDDCISFKQANDIESYHFWGQERVLLDAIDLGHEPELRGDEMKYFDMWHDTEASRMYKRLLSREFVNGALEAMEREY